MEATLDYAETHFPQLLRKVISGEFMDWADDSACSLNDNADFITAGTPVPDEGFLSPRTNRHRLAVSRSKMGAHFFISGIAGHMDDETVRI